MGGGGAVVVVAGGIKRLFTKEESLGVSCKSGRGIAAFVAALIRPYVSSSTMTLDILLRCTIPGMSVIDNAVSDSTRGSEKMFLARLLRILV